MKKIYYHEDKREFYLLTETDKQIKVKWIPKATSKRIKCDESGEITEEITGYLDFNVVDKELVCKKDKPGKHCLKTWGDGTYTIYPNRNGQPFYIRPATAEDCDKEIEDCKEWGVNHGYYEIIKDIIIKQRK